MTYFTRNIEQIITNYIASFPVVGITGPRQSGKSRVLQELLGKKYQYVSFDDPDILEIYHKDPKRLITQYNHKVVFDEIQRAPKMFHAIKLAVDQDRDCYGKFIVTGSNQFSLMHSITESLAGRIGLLTVLPLQYNEAPKKQSNNNIEAVFRGSFPELVVRDYKNANIWYKSYLQTYLEKDVRTVTNIDKLYDFRRLISLLAARASQELHMATLARELGVSHGTIKNWISILEASYIIFLIPPYHNNFGKRIIKSPKLYFYDTGIVAHLTGIISAELYEKGPMRSALFENYVVAEILKQKMHNDLNTELYYYRNTNGDEIDLIVENANHKELIEIKSSYTYRSKMTSTIEKYLTDNDKGTLVFQGNTMPALNNLHIVNYQDYLLF